MRMFGVDAYLGQAVVIVMMVMLGDCGVFVCVRACERLPTVHFAFLLSDDCMVLVLAGIGNIRSVTGLGALDVPTALRHFTQFADQNGVLKKPAFYQAFNALVSGCSVYGHRL